MNAHIRALVRQNGYDNDLLVPRDRVIVNCWLEIANETIRYSVVLLDGSGGVENTSFQLTKDEYILIRKQLEDE